MLTNSIDTNFCTIIYNNSNQRPDNYFYTYFTFYLICITILVTFVCRKIGIIPKMLARCHPDCLQKRIKNPKYYTLYSKAYKRKELAMKREIKFRGGHIDTGEWVYGHLIGGVNNTHYIINNMLEANDEYCIIEKWQRVDPETVGEYTGLKDKNGKEIYEGDVVDVCRYGSDVYRVVVEDIRQLPRELFGSELDWALVVSDTHKTPNS